MATSYDMSNITDFPEPVVAGRVYNLQMTSRDRYGNLVNQSQLNDTSSSDFQVLLSPSIGQYGLTVFSNGICLIYNI